MFFVDVNLKCKTSLKLLSIMTAILLTSPVKASDDVEFDSDFFSVGDNVDISQFSQEAYIPPGFYPSNIYLNGEFLFNSSIEIKQDEFGNSVPCLSSKLLKLLQFDEKYIPQSLIDDLSGNRECVDLVEHIPSAMVGFDLSLNQLDLQVSQIYLQRLVRGYVPESMWDSGISALSVSYNLNGYSSDGRQSISGSINSGFGIGSWYLRHRGSLNWNSQDEEFTYRATETYLEKPIPQIKSNMQIGYTNTGGRVFGSMPLTGISLEDDQSMLPIVQRGYAPEIKGVARTTAKVTVSQNGVLIHESTVPPGPFIIDDLSPRGYGGTLDVVIEESNGAEQHFSVPYEGLVQHLRPGSSRYAFALGQYRNESLLRAPLLVEASYERGLSNTVTGYLGVQGNEDYIGAKFGTAVGTLGGAFSFDVTLSDARFLDDHRGQSYEVKYSKNFTSIGNNISLGAYRYSTEKFLDYGTAMQINDYLVRGGRYEDVYRSKNRFVLNVNQRLWNNWGNIYLTGTRENYWNDKDYVDSLQFGYSNHFKYFSLGTNVSVYKDQFGENRTSYSANVSIPLRGAYDNPRINNISLSHSGNDQGGTSQRMSLSGVAGEDNAIDFGLSASRIDNDGSTSYTTDASVGYSSRYSRFRASVSNGDGYSSQSVSMSGSVIAHKGGITLSPDSGDTFALIEAKGAEGASVVGRKNVKVDSNGYAVVSSMTPYQINEVHLDTMGTKGSVELQSSSQQTVPFRNAVTLLKFDTIPGHPLIIYTAYKGQEIAFGSAVRDNEGRIIGNVGQGGQLYARVPENKGRMVISLGNGEECSIAYSLSQNQLESGRLSILKKTCE